MPSRCERAVQPDFGRGVRILRLLGRLHYGRRGSHSDQTRSLSFQLADELGLDRPPITLRYRPWSPRAFMIIPASAHRSAVHERIAELLRGEWGRWFAQRLPESAPKRF